MNGDLSVNGIAALEYARMGWHIFPLKPGTKFPFKGFSWRDRSTRSFTTIARWWERVPDANIAVDCGKSGLLVVDLDGPEGTDEFRQLAQGETVAPMQYTGGGGQQLFFINTGDWRNTSKQLGTHIDTRGVGGYAVLPPSRHPSGKRYEWRIKPTRLAPHPPPGWLRDLLEARICAPEAPNPPPTQGNGNRWLTEALRRARPGSRNATGFWLAAQLRDDGISQAEAEAIMTMYASTVAHRGGHVYSQREALATLRSAYLAPRREPAERVR